MTTLALVSIVAIISFAAFGQTVAGFGFSLLAVPPLGMVIDAKDAIAVSVVLLIVNSAVLAWGERAHIEWDAVRSLLGGAVFGLPLGVAIIAVAPVQALRVGLGIAVLGAVTIMATGFTPARGGRGLELSGGFLCGLLTTSLNTNGPPAVLALQPRNLAPEQFRPTTSTVLGATSLVGAALFAAADRMNGDVVQTCLISIPSMVLGWRVGLSVRPSVPAHQFRILIMALLVAAALLTLVAAVR